MFTLDCQGITMELSNRRANEGTNITVTCTTRCNYKPSIYLQEEGARVVKAEATGQSASFFYTLTRRHETLTCRVRGFPELTVRATVDVLCKSLVRSPKAFDMFIMLFILFFRQTRHITDQQLRWS